MIALRQKDLKFVLSNLILKKKSFYVLKKRGSSTLIHGRRKTYFGTQYKNKKQYIVLDQKKRTKANTVFSQVAKAWNDFIIKSDFTIKKVDFNSPSSFTDRVLFKKIKEDEQLYYIDVNNCFWEINYRLGYCKEKLYLKYLEDEEIKLFRNMSLSMQTSEQEMDYYKKGVKFRTIKENKNLHKIMYENIRKTSYNLIADAFSIAESYGDGIMYRTDGLLIRKLKVVEKVLDFFAENGFEVKATKFIKIDETTIVSLDSGETKKI